jgi:hypothetical protein
MEKDDREENDDACVLTRVLVSDERALYRDRQSERAPTLTLNNKSRSWPPGAGRSVRARRMTTVKPLDVAGWLPLPASLHCIHTIYGSHHHRPCIHHRPSSPSLPHRRGRVLPAKVRIIPHLLIQCPPICQYIISVR